MIGMVEWLQMIILVACLNLGASGLVLYATEMSMPLIAYKEEKTALTVENAIDDIDGMRTGSDLFMSLYLTEENTPYPKQIRVNSTPIIKLDSAFVVNKYTRMAQLYTGVWDFKSLMGKNITDRVFVTDPVNGDYIQYTLD